MRVLVTGANGFIASGVVESLLAHGHEVRACVRVGSRPVDARRVETVFIDRAAAISPDAWTEHLVGIDAVVNCAGILRGRGRDTFERVHLQFPKALALACVSAGVAKFIQISALGNARSGGEFVSSKHHLDEWLLSSGIAATVIRPSVVVSTRGAYGGTSLLRGLAALPGVVFLPGDGMQRIQPVLLEDLAELVARCLPAEVATGQTLYAVGPAPLTIRTYLLLTRAWLRLPAPRVVRVPMAIVRAGAACGDILGRGPLGRTMAGMLESGNVAEAEAVEQATDATGWCPRSVLDALAHTPSFEQDRQHARAYFLRPFALLTLAAVWIGSGIAGLLASPEEWRDAIEAIGITNDFQWPTIVALSVFNIALGLGLLVLRRARIVLALMLISVCAYTAVLGVLLPGLWLEPLGALLKNLPIIALLALLFATEDSR